MKTIVAIILAKLSHLLNDEHFNFIEDIIAVSLKFDPKKQKVEKEIATLQAAHAKESAALDPVRSSKYTEQIRECDALRTTTAKGLESLVRANLKNPDKPSAQAAKDVMALFKSHADIYDRSYNIKTAIITDIINEINKSHTADIALLGAASWVTNLDAQNKDFAALMEKRFEETSKRNGVNMEALRLEVDDAYLTLTTRLTALMVIEEPDKFYPYVEELNEYIKYYNGRVKLRETNNKSKQRNIASAQLSPIPAQTYTGSHIIPVVELLYTDEKTISTGLVAERSRSTATTTVRLEEDKDYTLTAENNVQVGSATLTIKGKGAYVGKMVCVFAIVAE